MAAPSGKIPLPPEAYAALGDFRSAIRELTKLKGELETIATQTIAAQGKIDPATKSQIDQTKGKIAYYKAQEESRKEAATEARKSTLKTIAGLVNTHNPHGALRSLLSGSASTGGTVTNLAGQVGGLLQSLGMGTGSTKLVQAGTSLINGSNIAALSGAAGIAGTAAHIVAEALQQAATKHAENEQRRKQLAGESLSFTRKQRLTSLYTAEDLKRYMHGGADAERTGGSQNQSLLDMIPGLGRPDAEKRGLEARAAFQNTFGMRRRVEQALGTEAADRILNARTYRDDQDVRYNNTSIIQIGTVEWVKRRVAAGLNKGLAFFGGGTTTLPDYDGEAIKKGAEEKALKAGRTALALQEDATKAWFDQPINRAIAAQFERHSRAVEEFAVDRVGQWNPY